MKLSRRHTLYGYNALLIGMASVAIWAWLSARVQQGNADQLVDGFLFENAQTFAGATFPSSHTQLLKWPLFAMLRWWHFSADAYAGLTILLALTTMGGFYYLLACIERRPWRLGVLGLALTSVLMLTPAQVFDGVTSPFNLAMLTGRNIEYLVFIAVLVGYATTHRWRSWQFGTITAALAVLMASDHLYVILSLGGALVLGIVAWVLAHRWLQPVAWRWLAGGGVAWVGAAAVQTLLGRFTHIVVDAPPYGMIRAWPNLGQSLVGTSQALALNFGLNSRAGLPAVPALIANGLIAACIAVAAYGIAKQLYNDRDQPPREASVAVTLAAMLLAAAVTAIITQAAFNQPYLSNARYLTIALPAGFVSLAVWQRGRQLKPRQLLIAARLAAASVAVGLTYTRQHTQTVLAHDQLRWRNQQIVAALRQHPEEFVVGNYWRVMPIRLMSPGGRQAVVPLDGCLKATRLLGSTAWQPDLRSHSFAYVLSLNDTEVPGSTCAERAIISHYGRPTSVKITAGDSLHPAEELLLYDSGATYNR